MEPRPSTRRSPSGNSLSTMSLLLSMVMLLVTLVAGVLTIFQGRHIPYDADWMLLPALGLIALCLLTFVVSIVAVAKDSRWRSITSLLVAIVGLLASVGDLVLLGAVMLANHPV